MLGKEVKGRGWRERKRGPSTEQPNREPTEQAGILYRRAGRAPAGRLCSVRFCRDSREPWGEGP